MTPHRIQLRRTKGWRMPPNTARVCRPTLWGNPFTHPDPAQAVAAFRHHIQGNSQVHRIEPGGLQLTARGRCTRNGRAASATSASRPGCRSTSSSGGGWAPVCAMSDEQIDAWGDGRIYLSTYRF